MIIEASWQAVRKDPVMQNYFRSHAGKNSKAAIFKVGRKLLSKIHAVIRTSKDNKTLDVLNTQVIACCFALFIDLIDACEH